MEKEIQSLLKKPMWQMTGEEFLYLFKVNGENAKAQPHENYAYGMRALGDAIGCSLSTIYDLKKKGVLDEAIVSFVGRKIAFDVNTARFLADKYQSEQRDLRQMVRNSNVEENGRRD